MGPKKAAKMMCGNTVPFNSLPPETQKILREFRKELERKWAEDNGGLQELRERKAQEMQEGE